MSIYPIDKYGKLTYNKTMKCEFKFCIYNENNKCTLDEISVNFYGVCDSALYVEIDEETLEKSKMQTKETYHSYWQ